MYIRIISRQQRQEITTRIIPLKERSIDIAELLNTILETNRSSKISLLGDIANKAVKLVRELNNKNIEIRFFSLRRRPEDIKNLLLTGIDYTAENKIISKAVERHIQYIYSFFWTLRLKKIDRGAETLIDPFTDEWLDVNKTVLNLPVADIAGITVKGEERSLILYNSNYTLTLFEALLTYMTNNNDRRLIDSIYRDVIHFIRKIITSTKTPLVKLEYGENTDRILNELADIVTRTLRENTQFRDYLLTYLLLAGALTDLGTIFQGELTVQRHLGCMIGTYNTYQREEAYIMSSVVSMILIAINTAVTVKMRENIYPIKEGASSLIERVTRRLRRILPSFQLITGGTILTLINMLTTLINLGECSYLT